MSRRLKYSGRVYPRVQTFSKFFPRIVGVFAGKNPRKINLMNTQAKDMDPVGPVYPLLFERVTSLFFYCTEHFFNNAGNFSRRE